MIMSIVFGVLGVGLIIFGIKILLTGTLTKSEEAKIASYSKKGARAYKLINVVMYECIVDFLEFQKILNDVFWIKAILFGAIILMVIIYFIVASKCKKMTDNE